MTHNVMIAFDFDDETVAKNIESSVEKKVIDNITKEVENIIFSKSYYSREKDDEPLRSLVTHNVQEIINEQKEKIISLAADRVADSIKKSKQYKEALKGIEE